MYVPSLVSILFVLPKIWPGQASVMKKWLWGDNSENIQARIIDFCALPFHSLLSIYKPSFISISLVLSKIWPRQESIIKNKWLWGDNSVNIQGRSMVLVHCPSSYCHLPINQVSFQSLLYFPRYRPDRHPL